MKNKNKKLPKHIIVPLCIAIYFVVIAYVNRNEWLIEGNAVSYWSKIIIEIIILFILSILIKKREEYRNRRKEDK